MRALPWLSVASALLLASSAPAEQPGRPLEVALQQARTEQAQADAETARLQEAASRAQGEAARLRAEQAAAAQAIEAAEARITTASEQLKIASDYVAAHRQKLIVEQQPVSSLLAGLALMARRPPLLALANHRSIDELVEVRVLLDSTLPVIRRRTQGLTAQLAEGERLQRAAAEARAELVRSRQNLDGKQRGFASLEQKAFQQALAKGGQALGAGDVAIAAGEDIEHLRSEQIGRQSALAMAGKLASEEPPPLRPFSGEGTVVRPPFDYRLPADAAVTQGLSEISDSGVRSRGITLATSRGAAVAAPADGIIRFSGPFGNYDGVLIIDHGAGWKSLIVNVSSELRPGSKVRVGDPVGRALGPLSVELSHNGNRISPALIAGSYQSLSKAMKGG